MANTTSTSQPCCTSLVCLVPAALPQTAAGMQPVPLYMIAPMASPVLFPQLDITDSGDAGYSNAGFTGMPVPWVTTPWHSYQPFGEEAPQQLPMDDGTQALPVNIGGLSFSAEGFNPYMSEATYPEEDLGQQVESEEALHYGLPLVTADCCQEEVPPQVEMYSAVSHPQVQIQKSPSVGTATLRRRRGQEFSCQGAQYVNGAGVGSMEETDDADAEANDTQAREIATRLMEQFQSGSKGQHDAIAHFQRLAFLSQTASRAAQIVLDEASMQDAAAIATGLRGHIRNAAQSKHANHVVQKITEVMPAARASFIVDELNGIGLEVARNSFGCRVMCRILEHLSVNDGKTIALAHEIAAGAEALCNHPFGSYVVRHLLEFGLPIHRHLVAKALLQDLQGHATHKFGSHVVESALSHCNADDQKELARQLLGNRHQLFVLATSQFGRHVGRALLNVHGDLKKEAIEAFRPMEDQLKASRYGKSVMQAFRAAA